MLSLVGLRAVDVVKEVGERPYTELTSYNKPIAGIVPHIGCSEDFVRLFLAMRENLGIQDYKIVKIPKTRQELARLCRSFEEGICE